MRKGMDIFVFSQINMGPIQAWLDRILEYENEKTMIYKAFSLCVCVYHFSFL